MAAPPGSGVGSFRVALSSITIDRMDHQPEDDFKTWAQVVVVTRGRASPKFWFAGEADANLAKTSVTPGNEAAAYNFSRNSKDFPLDVANLSDLCNSVLQVNVFKGGLRDTAKDSWVGWFTVDLAELVGGARLKGGFGLTPPSEFLAKPPFTPAGAVPSASAYTGKVQAEFRPSAALEEAGVGARLLTVTACQLAQPPLRWRLPAADYDVDEAAPAVAVDPAAAQALCEDADENPFRYVLSLSLAPERVVHVPTGALRFVAHAAHAGGGGGGSDGASSANSGDASRPPTAAGAAAAAVAGSKAGSKPGAGGKVAPAAAGDAAAASPTGAWSVGFRDARIFLTKDLVLEMAQHLGSGALVEGRLRRVACEAVEEDDPDDATYGLEARRLLEESLDYRAGVSLALDALLLQGVTRATTEVNVRPEAVPDAERAAEPAKREAREAEWQEYLAAKAKRAAERGAAAGAGGKGLKSPADAKPAPKKEEKKKDDKKGAKGGKGGKGDAPAEPEGPPVPKQHPYDAAGTVLAISLLLNKPLTPRPATPPPVELTVEDLIPQRGRAMAAPPSLDASQEFRREVANAVGAVAKEFAAVMAAGGGPSQPASLGGTGAAAAAASAAEMTRAELLRRLKEGGAYANIRETLRRCTAKIVRERFQFLPGYSDPLDSPGKDELFAHVYAYCVGQMHASLNATFADAERVAPSIGQSSIFQASPATATAAATQGMQQRGASGSPSTTHLGASERGGGPESPRPRSAAAAALLAASGPLSSAPVVHIATPAEATLARLRRVAAECEFSGHSERAARLHQTRIAMAEEAAARGLSRGAFDPSVWYDYGLFNLRRGEQLKAATCLREALSCDGEFVPALLALAALQCARGHADESVVFAAQAAAVLQAGADADARAIAASEGARGAAAAAGPGAPARRVSERENVLPLAHALHALSLELCERSEDAGHALQSAVAVLAHLFTARAALEDDVARSATAGGAYLVLSRYLLDLQLDMLARVTIERAHNALLDTDAPRVQRVDMLVLRVRQYAQAMNAATAIDLSEYLPADPQGQRSRLAATAASAANDRAHTVGSSRRNARLDHAPVGGSGGGASSSSEARPGAASAAPAAPISAAPGGSGYAYDGALLQAEEALRHVSRACELLNLCSEAWALRGLLWATGLAGPSYRRSLSGVDVPLLGTRDLGDLELDELVEGRRFLELARSTYEAPMHCGSALLLHAPLRSLAPPPPSKDEVAAAAALAAAGAAPPAAAQAQAQTQTQAQPQVPDASRSVSVLSSASGVGGSLLASDEFAHIRLFLRLAAVQLQLAAAETPAKAPAMLAAAKDSYVRSVHAGRAAAALVPGQHAGPWSLSWLGVGRAAWAQGDHSEAEIALGEANALDNQNPVVWAWLSFLCLSADPLRDREAAASLDQALKNSLAGDCTETVVLLHTLADRYRALGQAGVAAGLLRRAVVFVGEPVSGAHQDAMLHARMALAEVLADSGAIEDSLKQYRAVMSVKGLSGIVLPVALKDSVRATRHAAAAAAAQLLTRLGRDSEARELLVIHGAGKPAALEVAKSLARPASSRNLAAKEHEGKE